MRITVEMYDEKVEQYKERQEQIIEQKGMHSKADESYYVNASRLLEVANSLRDI